MFLPPFHFSEIKGNLSVGNSLLVQVAAVPPDECRHVVTCAQEKVHQDIILPNTVPRGLTPYLGGRFCPENC